jgi:hypothetical protein
VRSENLPAIIAAGDDVIEPAADFDSWFPGHYGTEIISAELQMSRNSGLTPLWLF